MYHTSEININVEKYFHYLANHWLLKCNLFEINVAETMRKSIN